MFCIVEGSFIGFFLRKDVFRMGLLYPNQCPVCGKLIPFNQTYCKCSDAPSQLVPLNDDDPSFEDDPLFPFTAVWYYGGRIRFDLLSLKFHRKASLAKPLGLAMAQRVAQAFPTVSFDCVTFVPMTADDLRERSFNQSALLAQWVARAFFIQCSALLQKVRATPCQHMLNQSERYQNNRHNAAPLQGYTAGSRRKGSVLPDLRHVGLLLSRFLNSPVFYVKLFHRKV